MTHMRLAAALLVLAVVIAACGAGEVVEPGPLGVGRGIYGDVCSACHGNRGQGGTGPELTEVDLDFPACSDHIEWVHLGSNKWRRANGDTYGALDKPIQGGMPSMEDRFDDDEIAAVVLFERVEYAGLPLEATAADCALGREP